MTPEISVPRPPAGSGAAERRPLRPQTGAALALLAAVLVTAITCLLTIQAAPLPQRPAVAWGSIIAAVVLCAAVTAGAYHYFGTLQLRALLAGKDSELAGRDSAAAAQRASDEQFANNTVPFVVERLRQGASAETALAAAPPTESTTQRQVLTTLATEVHRGERLRAAAMSACANAAGRVQALSTSMAADLRDMEHRHADEEVLGDLLHLDHRTAQAGRLADSIAVLTGARSGRRWAKPIVMESILRGALGRISGYQRVRLHSTSTAAVAGHAAEGVMHVLAELMDNAANFSPPTSEVHVYVEEVSAGVVITVEDAGLVMGEVALQRAQQAVSGDSFDLAALSGSRLGLAVVGRLSAKHALSVSFRPSAHGGTGVVVMLPQEIITEPRRTDRAAAPKAAAGTTPATGTSPSRPGHSERPGQSGQGNPRLPQESRASSEHPPTRGESEASSGSQQHATDHELPQRERTTRLGSVPPEQRRGPQARSERATREEHTTHSNTADSAPVRGRPQADTPAAGTSVPGQPGPSRPGADQAAAEETSQGQEFGESGLPKRRRGQTLASSQRSRAPEQDTGSVRTPQQSGSRLGAFRKAVQGSQAARGSGNSDTGETPLPQVPGDQDEGQDGIPEAGRATPADDAPRDTGRPHRGQEPGAGGDLTDTGSQVPPAPASPAPETAASRPEDDTE